MVKKPSPAPSAEDADQSNYQWVNGKYRHKLVRPIPDGSGGETEYVTLREPNTGDVMEAGNPCTLDPATNPPRVLFDEKKAGAMISRLAALPPSSIMRMHPKDFTSLGWALADFFLPV